MDEIRLAVKNIVRRYYRECGQHLSSIGIRNDIAVEYGVEYPVGKVESALDTLALAGELVLVSRLTFGAQYKVV